MKFAYDLPGYVQGHRFSDDPLFYDSSKERFTDLSGGDRFQRYVSKTSGTPTFADRGVNSRRGLYLDNTNQWQFPFATPWMGSGILVASYNTLEGNTSGYVFGHIFGYSDIANISNDPFIFGKYYYDQRTLQVWGATSKLTTSLAIPDDTIVVMAWSRDQQDRTVRMTLDGVTVIADATDTGYPTTGDFIGLGVAKMCRLGNVTGDKTSTAVSTQGTMHIFEQHFFNTNILRDHLAQTKELIDTLKSYYGVV